ncbi:hypothetical protein AG1IA_00726 [Rhizoctonia solani AG-1 IA]|uniref:Uncharacterized protein n=1 Tax=Thanatephorus cucumeris (strain AG1-IA) TaxID=983506 RepID=L8X4W6_THACA|nr:hypothetical protein AG1IA_00726 [Rhizoctonia solani AG-1 IA]
MESRCRPDGMSTRIRSAQARGSTGRRLEDNDNQAKRELRSNSFVLSPREIFNKAENENCGMRHSHISWSCHSDTEVCFFRQLASGGLSLVNLFLFTRKHPHGSYM